jgi:hypothetical protein
MMMTVSATLTEYVFGFREYATYNSGFQTFRRTTKLQSSGLIIRVESGSSNTDLAVGGVKVKVTLRPTTSRSVRLGFEPRLGLMIRCYLLFDSYCFVDIGRPL